MTCAGSEIRCPALFNACICQHEKRNYPFVSVISDCSCMMQNSNRISKWVSVVVTSLLPLIWHIMVSRFFSPTWVPAAPELAFFLFLKNQSSFKFTFHILANGGLAWKYRLFRHFPFGRYLAYRSTTRQVFSFKSSTKVVNRALTTKRPCFRKLSVPPAVPLHGAFRCGPFLPWLSYRLHGRNSSASW